MSKSQLIKELKQEKEQIDKAIEVIEQLPDDMPGCVKANMYSDSFTLFVETVSPDEFKKARRALGKQARRSGSIFYSGRGARVHVYHWLPGQCNIQLSLEPGKVCRRVQVGERIEPIYRVVCD